MLEITILSHWEMKLPFVLEKAISCDDSENLDLTLRPSAKIQTALNIDSQGKEKCRKDQRVELTLCSVEFLYSSVRQGKACDKVAPLSQVLQLMSI